MRDIQPLPVMRRQDAHEALQGLAAGWYPAKELHQRYVEHMEAKGELPAHAVAFGQALRLMGAGRRKKKHHGAVTHGWVIGRAVLDEKPPED